jgi:ribosomal protein S18 acetylase RimI-like enzyme
MIKNSRAADLNAIYELEKQFGADAFSKRSLRRFHENGNLLVFLDNQDTIIGSAIVVHRKNSDKVRLYSFVIDQKFRGMGVGKTYLETLLSIPWDAIWMILEVSEGNHPAIHVYQKAGFEEIQRIEGYYSDGSSAIKMIKNLKK